ncbi:hypothetical protein GW17_00028417 [Ensete ventricosum]|nr:hypothetical protein GW17_00028417 [Ensete ventricosum]RZR86004.1 hypothetical protein BHM03_00013088 [Ensete ventricosum]
MTNPLRERHHEDKLILHGVKDEGSFKAHAPCLRDAFDGGTKVIQLAEAKLGSKGLSTRQEDVEAGTLEEYATVLPFKLSGKRCAAEIMLVGDRGPGSRQWCINYSEVGISELPKERTQSEMAEALRCAGRGTHGEIVV